MAVLRCSPVHLDIVPHQIVNSSGRAATQQVVDYCLRSRNNLVVFAPICGQCCILVCHVPCKRCSVRWPGCAKVRYREPEVRSTNYLQAWLRGTLSERRGVRRRVKMYRGRAPAVMLV